ncbi:MAG: PAS domain S-box protein, partial [Flavisolibacter sp.]
MKNQSSQQNIFTPVNESLPHADALALILNNLEDTFLLVNRDLQIILANEASRANVKYVFGVTLTNTTSVLDLVPPERHATLKELYQEVLEGAIKTTEIEVKKESSILYFENHFKPARDAEGNIVAVIVSSRNITEKKQSELKQLEAKESLKLSEQQYKTLFQNNPLPCWIYDYTTLRFLEVNEAATRHYGYSRKEFLNLTVLDLQVEGNLADLKERFEKKKIKRIYFLNNWQHKLKDGRTIFIDLRSSAISYQNVDARLVVVQDVTPRVVIENELRKSNERFQLAAKASSEALWEWDFVSKE